MKELLGVISFILVVILLVVGAAKWYEKYDCDNLQARTGLRTEWYFFGGCYVEVNDRLVPRENWRGEYDR